MPAVPVMSQVLPVPCEAWRVQAARGLGARGAGVAVGAPGESYACGWVVGVVCLGWEGCAMWALGMLCMPAIGCDRNGN